MRIFILSQAEAPVRIETVDLKEHLFIRSRVDFPHTGKRQVRFPLGFRSDEGFDKHRQHDRVRDIQVSAAGVAVLAFVIEHVTPGGVDHAAGSRKRRFSLR